MAKARDKEYEQQMLTLLLEITERLLSVEKALARCTISSSAPPGLETSNQRIDGTQDTLLTDRVALLEKVYVLTDWEALESACNAVTSSTASPTLESCNGPSPSDMSTDNESNNKRVDTEVFDLFENGKDVATQTFPTESNTFLTEMKDKLDKVTWEAFDVLKVGDVIKTKVAFMSFDRGLKVELPANIFGKVDFVDSDGDALIFFPQLCPYLLDAKCWARNCDFRNLLLLQ